MLEMELQSFGAPDNLPRIQLRPNCLLIIPCSTFNESAYNERAASYYMKKKRVIYLHLRGRGGAGAPEST